MNSRRIVARTVILAASLAAAPAIAAAMVLAAAPAIGAQQATDALRVSAVLSADTVRVGEPFTIGVVAISTDPITVPSLLPSGEGWEQLEVARVERTDSGIRVYYRLVAWQTGRFQFPDLSLSVGEDGGRQFSISMPAPIVRSVLPAAEESPLLQPPRPPLEAGFPWAWLLAALILLALILWWLKHRTPSPVLASSAAEDGLDAAARARAAILALRDDAEAGSVAAAGFYDRLEQILRGYLSGTRAWPSGHPVRESRALSGAAMRDLHRQAVLARFAAVAWPAPRLVADADVSLDWLAEDGGEGAMNGR